tara:strand:- start:517 stop:903 length:387 start_codon:yes stop_codon:yes gene_type:complete
MRNENYFILESEAELSIFDRRLVGIKPPGNSENGNTVGAVFNKRYNEFLYQVYQGGVPTNRVRHICADDSQRAFSMDGISFRNIEDRPDHKKGLIYERGPGERDHEDMVDLLISNGAWEIPRLMEAVA